MEQFLDDLGAGVRARPAPTLRGSTVATGGVLIMIGLLTLALDVNESDTNVIGILFGLLAVGAGHAIIAKLNAGVAPAGIALIALGTISALGLVFDDVSSPTALLAVAALAYGAQWAVGPAKGSMPLLTFALFSLWGLLIDTIAGDPEPSVFTDTIEFIPQTPLSSGDDTVSYVALLLGVGLLFAARALDIRGFHGVATSAIIVGDVSFVVGSFGVAAILESDGVGGLLITLAGATLAWIGATGDRRVTTWLGGIGILIGVLVLLTAAVEFSDGTQFGIAAIVFGAAIIGGGALANLPSAPSGTPDMDTPLADTPPTDTPLTEAMATPAIVETPATVATPQDASVAWHPDPTERHELRWYDGSAWTANVSDQGVVSTDEGV
jgi:hypothetical protein